MGIFAVCIVISCLLSGCSAEKTADSTGSTGTYTSNSDFNGKRIGVGTGTIQGPLVERELPDAQLSYYNTTVDLLNALQQGKIDGFADSELIVRFMMSENDDVTYLD